MIKNNNIQALRNAADVGKCPDGKLALNTNVNFNNGSPANYTNDILIMPPDIQLDERALASYDFTVEIPSPPLYNLNSGKAWKGATNSVASGSLTMVDLKMALPDHHRVQVGNSGYCVLQISNKSGGSINGARLDSTSGDNSVFTVQNPTTIVNIPGWQTTSLYMLLNGLQTGSATCYCTLTLPKNFINAGNNTDEVTISVSNFRPLQVTVGTVTNWPYTWPSTEQIYSYPLTMISADTAVTTWQLSFLLPDGAHLNQAWLESAISWVKVNTEKSVNGNIYLDSQPGLVIAPESYLDLTIQINYPDVSIEHETLNNLRLVQIY